MLDPDFARYQPGHDKFNVAPATLRLTDLPPRWEGEPALSILMTANDFRAAQISRSLECLARQEMREFEVLVCDNGSALPLAPIVDLFRPYLQVQTVRLERDEFLACPTTGFKALLPMARGGIIAIQQPEMMLKPSATRYLVEPHFADLADVHRYKVSTSRVSMAGRPTWVTLKPAPLSEQITQDLDGLNWHGDLSVIDQQPGFDWNGQNFAGLSVADVAARREWPWWFVASTLREADIWNAMPIFKGHASIDFWMLNYRRVYEYTELAPHAVMCYHQAHLRTSHMPAHEVEDSVVPPVSLPYGLMDLEELRAWARSYGAEDGGDYEEVWAKLVAAREADHQSGSHRRPGGEHSTTVFVGPITDRPDEELSVRLRRIRRGQ